MTKRKALLTILTAVMFCTIPGGAARAQATMPLNEMISRFAPTPITADLSHLSPGDKAALNKLFEVARLFDKIYTRQVWSGNEAMRIKLEAAATDEHGKEILHYYDINRSPWSNVDGNTPFVEGAPANKPDGANYYPEDMTKNEFDTWSAALPVAQQKQATGFFYMIKRDAGGKLTPKAYADEYNDLLVPAAKLMHEAADLTGNPSLKAFLNKRGEAFLSNDYFDSDVAWMDLNSPIDPTIGPYEVYLDNLYNYKAAFEAYINIRDEDASAKLNKFSSYLQDVEDHLPIDPKYRNPKLGSSSPIDVVDEVMEGGEARSGVQTAAYNLPNDEAVSALKGNKRILLKNVQEAKFKSVLVPIAAVVIAPEFQKSVAFEPFFTHILAHELMHGLGPHYVMTDSKQTPVREVMKEQGSALEEAKADISGLYMLGYLMDKGSLDPSGRESLYATYVASCFRSVRFGVKEAHGKGTAMQFNFLSDEGAITYDEKAGTFGVDMTKMPDAVKKLTAKIMTLQAEGKYDEAKQFLSSYGVIRPPMKAALDKLKSVPIDIEPIFSSAN